MDLGVHLPLIPFAGELSFDRLAKAVDAAREGGYPAISANDHFLFQTPWLDGPAALASMIERSGRMTLATTIALPVVRGPVALAKALMAIDLLSGGRCLAGVGPARATAGWGPPTTRHRSGSPPPARTCPPAAPTRWPRCGPPR